MQPKAVERKDEVVEPAPSASVASVAVDSREHKIRKTDSAFASVQDEKMELTEPTLNVAINEELKPTLQDNGSEVKDEEKMEVCSTEPTANATDRVEEDDSDAGEIHIVSISRVIFVSHNPDYIEVLFSFSHFHHMNI